LNKMPCCFLKCVKYGEGVAVGEASFAEKLQIGVGVVMFERRGAGPSKMLQLS